MEIPDHFIGDGKYFVMRIKGDKYKEFGLKDNDVILIKKQSCANDDDIVVWYNKDELRIHITLGMEHNSNILGIVDKVIRPLK